VIEKTDDSFKTVALVSHNPGITDFVNSLTKSRIDDMPTSGVFMIQSDIQYWKQFKNSEKAFLYFGYPNQL
jgi:phosphohistidine phosphatase